MFVDKYDYKYVGINKNTGYEYGYDMICYEWYDMIWYGYDMDQVSILASLLAIKALGKVL